MKTFKVTIVEHLTYEIEVEAENVEMAEIRAYSDEKFTSNLPDDNDSEAMFIEEI